MKKLITFALLIIFLQHSHLNAQSGWTKPKGEGYFQLSYQYFASDQYYNLSGNKLETNQFQQQSIALYAEYGLLDQLTLITQFPIQTFNSFETTETVSGIGDLRVELKYALPVNFPVAISVAPELPTAKANNFAQNKEIAFDRINLPAGDGEFNLWSTLVASHSFKNLPLYASLFVAYNLRTSYEGNEFSDQMHLGAEVGYKILDKVWVNARLNALASVENVQQVRDFVRGDGAEYRAYSFGILAPVYKNFSINLSYRNFNDWIFSRKNIYSSGIFGAGIIYELKPIKK